MGSFQELWTCEVVVVVLCRGQNVIHTQKD